MTTPLNSLSANKDNNFTAIPGIIQEPDFKEMQSQALVSQTEIVHKPEIAISISQNGKEFCLCTLGNFMVLTGKAKSRKSFFAHFLIAAALLPGNDGQ